ncbi:outer membrane protein assembly factor BamB family protein [Taibaiella soli]|uniref:Pyrrolo-quinoline quinone repeat domain-containing protein n=1 Tax=Taibaiella soli TaxID=1649169 RepID=A0A2W2AGY8_9BACT|nr:PQQ-binding-like beta-propeller repeat protein [Taibaiella soli]PZF72792.1 hypothetical protein DN068_10265 [Taibaiella soli]
MGYDGVAGFDLTTGAQLWQHSIKTQEKNVAESIKVLNDSIVAFSYSGLHVLNLKNGKGWDYEMVTSKTGSSGMGAETNMLPGVPVVMRGGSILKTSISSDIGYDTAQFYLADWIGLMAWNAATGKVVWEQEIETKMMSRSHIFIKGDIVYLLNRGAVGGNYKTDVNAGTTAFLAAYNRNSGAPLFFDTLGKKSVSSYWTKGNDCWIYNGSLFHVNLADGKFQTIYFHGKNAPASEAVVESANRVFVIGAEGKIQTLATRYAADFVLQDNEAGTLRVYGVNGNLLQTLQPAAYWLYKQQYRDMKVLDNFDGQLLFLKDGQAVLQTEPAKSNDIYADKLYRVVDKGLQVLSLPEVLNQ